MQIDQFFYQSGVCKASNNLKVEINGLFLQLGYDFELNPIIINTNLGLTVNGTVTGSNDSILLVSMIYDKKIDQSASYILFFSIAYRGIREYGLGLNYSSLKQKGDNSLKVHNWDNDEWSSKNIDPYEKTELRPVLWIGFDW